MEPESRDMTIEEVREFCSQQFVHTRQDALHFTRVLNGLIEEYGEDTDYQIVATECAFCEFQGISIVPTAFPFPISCPDCGERQVYEYGTYQQGGTS
jgi:hypothetical protein